MKTIFCKHLALAAIATVALNSCSSSTTEKADTNTRQPIAKHVVFIGLDGWAANTYEQGETPTLKGMAANGALTLEKRSVLPSSSAINWASIFMGVPTEVHGYLQWGSRAPELEQPTGAVKKHNIMPTIFQVARDQHPDADLAVFAEWDGIKYLVDTLSLTHFELPTFENMARVSGNYIKEHKPEITAIIFDYPDHTGHADGWGSPEYYAQMTKVDSYIADIIKSVEEAGIIDETVFVVTADHGGTDKGHGGTSMSEMLSPLIISGNGVKKGHKITELVMSPDITPTIAYILGLTPDPIWTGSPATSPFE